MPNLSTPVKGASMFFNLFKVLKDYWKQYGETALQQIHDIRKAYLNYFNEINPNASSAKASDIKEDIYPIYFRLDESGKLPVIYHDTYGFDLKLNSSDFISKIKKSVLSSDITDLINYIITYQVKRAEKFYGSGYDYDPIHLLCEELKVYLTNIPPEGFNETLKKDIIARIHYIRNLTKSEALAKENGKIFDEFTRKQLFLYLEQILEKKILPTIELEISKQSSITHFETLRNETIKLTRTLVEYLFYIFRDSKDVLPAFSLEEFRRAQPKLDEYKKIRQTLSGELLYTLTLTDKFHNVFGATVLNFNLLDTGTENSLFLTKYGQLRAPFAVLAYKPNAWEQDGNLIAWYKQENSGILPRFQNSELMNYFILAHILVEQLCHQFQVSNCSHDLAKLGGDLLVYGLLVEKISLIVGKITNFCGQITKVLKHLQNKANDYNTTLVEQQKEIDWQKKNYVLAKERYEIAQATITEIKKCAARILEAASISLDERHEQLKKKLAEFDENAKQFLSIQGKLDIIFSDNASLDNGFRNLALHEDNQQKLKLSNLNDRGKLFPKPQPLNVEKLQQHVDKAVEHLKEQNLLSAYEALESILPPPGVDPGEAHKHLISHQLYHQAFYMRASLFERLNDFKRAHLDCLFLQKICAKDWKDAQELYLRIENKINPSSKPNQETITSCQMKK